MDNSDIRVSALIFGMGRFKDDEDYNQGFVITPPPILHNTLFVPDQELGERKLNLVMQISLKDVVLISRNDPDIRHTPWQYRNARVQLSLTGTISSDGKVIVQSDLVCNHDVKFDERDLKVVSYQLEAYRTLTSKGKT